MSSVKWPGDPKDVNPALVQQGEQRETAFIEHPAGEDGVIEYDTNTLEILPIRWSHGPIQVPMEFLEVDQPYVATCSATRHGNRGCPAHKGCPYRNFPGVGPFQVIVKRKTRTEDIPCYNYFYARGSDGYRQATISYKSEGWEIDTSRTTVRRQTREMVTDPATGKTVKRDRFIEVPVQGLGPMYDHLKGENGADHGEGDPERAAVPHGPGNRRARLQQDAHAEGRGGADSHGEGRRRVPGRVPGSGMEAPEPDGGATKEVRGAENHRSPRPRRRNLPASGTQVSRSRVGTAGHPADVPGGLRSEGAVPGISEDQVQIRRRKLSRVLQGGEVDG